MPLALVTHAIHIDALQDGTVSYIMPSPASAVLPQETTAALIIPIFDPDNRPCLFAMVGSTESYFVFEKADEVFTRNVGAVVYGSLMRVRMINNDKAKLTYVSQISHELRTPLLGVASNVELIRAMSDSAHLRIIEPFLDVADVCINSLREVIDDTLLFSKLSHSTNASDRKAALTECDLENLVEDVFKGCYARHNQTLKAITDKPDSIKDQKVKLVLETRGRIQARVDVGGFKRGGWIFAAPEACFTYFRATSAIQPGRKLAQVHGKGQHYGISASAAVQERSRPPQGEGDRCRHGKRHE